MWLMWDRNCNAGAPIWGAALHLCLWYFEKKKPPRGSADVSMLWTCHLLHYRGLRQWRWISARENSPHLHPWCYLIGLGREQQYCVKMLLGCDKHGPWEGWDSRYRLFSSLLMVASQAATHPLRSGRGHVLSYATLHPNTAFLPHNICISSSGQGVPGWWEHWHIASVCDKYNISYTLRGGE